ncbi:transcription factor IBH1 [Mercurialis annua]|uniref:transcription factor IBH1 n=1 Tax=Mercurialis annua TaxID=3986 RepID=UPI002160BECF|nr:transcription factor IBH1 [Mercurialis annua]
MTSKNDKLIKSKKQSITKTRFTRKFISSLFKMRRASNRVVASSSVSSSNQRIRRTSRRIKISAYLSMARAVGSKRFWSRALLLKLRNRTGRISRNKWLVSKKKKKVIIKNKGLRETSKVDKLRKLVPGGESMDFCRLLEETAHYMKCLVTQVTVMQSIVDHISR